MMRNNTAPPLLLILCIPLLLVSCKPQTLTMTGLKPDFSGGHIQSTQVTGNSLQLTVEAPEGSAAVGISPWLLSAAVFQKGNWELKAVMDRQPYGIERSLEFRQDGRLRIIVAKGAATRIRGFSGFGLFPGSSLGAATEPRREWTTAIIKLPDGRSLTANPGDRIPLTNSSGEEWIFLLVGATRLAPSSPGVSDPQPVPEAADISADYFLYLP